MIERFSPRRQLIQQSFVNAPVQDIQRCVYIACYFRSSLLKAAGADLENVQGHIPDTLEAARINVAMDEIEEAK